MNEPVIVWIHGFPLSSRVFDRQRQIRGARHVMPDLPGFGRAPATPIRSLDEYAQFILRVLDEKKIDRAIFAGLSMGGYICLAIARIAPQRVSGLVLIDTRETPDAPDARQGRYDSIEKVKQSGVSPVVDSMLPKMLTGSAPSQLAGEVRTIMSSSSREGVIAALGAMAERGDSTAALRSINVPVLIVVGEDDPITPPSDAERMAGIAANATLVRIPAAAHLSNVEKADEFNRAVEAWLASFAKSE